MVSHVRVTSGGHAPCRGLCVGAQLVRGSRGESSAVAFGFGLLFEFSRGFLFGLGREVAGETLDVEDDRVEPRPSIWPRNEDIWPIANPGRAYSFG